MTEPVRGDVWWAEEPALGRRPALDVADGMPEACAATLDNVRPVRRSLLASRLTQLGPDRMSAVCDALRIAVDC